MLVLLAPSGASAAVHLDPIGSFDAPLYVTSLPNNADRLLVVEQGGTIQLVDHGVARLFLDLKTPGLVAAGGERGLLSVAPAPDYAATHRFYASFTRPDGALEVDEFTADGDSAPLSTRRPVLAVPHPKAANHNAGQLQFGPDGYLYISTGDGGGAGDVDGNAQNLSSLSGKILRIDPDPSGAQPYTIPPGNPFVGRAGARPEIWAYGFRNPWRFSFDRLTGALLIGDVGQGAREEVDYRTQPDPARGENFGWNCREGLIAYTAPGTACDGLAASAFVNPIFDYTHSGGGCAIVGGYVVRDTSLGDLDGRYLYTDNCDGTIRSLVPGQPFATDARSEGLSVSGPSSFGEDACGRVYVAALGGGGTVSRLEGDAPASCAAPRGGGRGHTPRRCGGEPATRVAGARRSISGSPGDDVIVADSRDDRIRSGAGDDVICALGGRDRIRAGRGDDRIRGGHGKDICVGGRGKDRTRSC